MTRKVLIFWYGKQWKKYVDYFYTIWDEISLVTYYYRDFDIRWVTKKYTFDEVEVKTSTFFETFDIIIIAVSPYKNQDIVIKFLIKQSLCNPQIIVEKPVTYNVELLSKIVSNDRFFFFIDEAYMFYEFIKSQAFSKIDSIHIIMYNNDPDYYKHILEHAMGFFFPHNDFQYFISCIQLNFFKNELVQHNDILKYRILINNRFIIDCHKWDILLNKVKIWNIEFKKVLSNMIDIMYYKYPINQAIKNNFLLYRKKYFYE